MPCRSGERQRQSAGAHYGDLPTQAVEPDGHEVRWTAAGCSGDLTLTGSYTTLRPIYLRRSSGLSSDAWKKSLVGRLPPPRHSEPLSQMHQVLSQEQPEEETRGLQGGAYKCRCN